MNTSLAMLLVLAACGGGSDNPPDAATTVIDAATPLDAPRDAAPDAPPVNIAKAKAHTLFLNVDGATVKPGADDATTDASSIVSASTTFAPWFANDADRTTKIQGVVATISATLSPYDITVVTTRPAAGPYHEILVTDDVATKIHTGFDFVFALTSTNCNQAPSVMAFVFPTNENPNEASRITYVEDFAIGYFGFLNGLPATKKTSDCMCLLDINCGQSACTIGGAGTAIDTSQGGAATCGFSGTTIDEAGAFLAAFGAHQ